ncbi:MAG: 16S rRNA processing protein RimM [Myxococcota bacterium]
MPLEGLEPVAPVVAAERVELGYVNGVFGVRGEVRLFLHNRDASWLGRPRKVLLSSPDGRWFTAELKARQGTGKRVLGRFKGVDDRDAAAALAGWRVVVPASELPAVSAGEYYIRDVIGLPVVIEGKEVGRVVQVHSIGGSDVLEVRLTDGTDTFVPSIIEFVEAVDPGAGEVRLHPGALGAEE